MKNDRMFGKLMPFKDENFALSHPYIELVTDKGYSVWKIFSAHVTSRAFYYIYVNFSSDDAFRNFLSALQERSLHDYGVNLTAEDRILTLSTCSYEFKDAFFAMHAVLVYEYDFPDGSIPAENSGGN
jgi:sortase B